MMPVSSVEDEVVYLNIHLGFQSVFLYVDCRLNKCIKCVTFHVLTGYTVHHEINDKYNGHHVYWCSFEIVFCTFHNMSSDNGHIMHPSNIHEIKHE